MLGESSATTTSTTELQLSHVPISVAHSGTSVRVQHYDDETKNDDDDDK